MAYATDSAITARSETKTSLRTRSRRGELAVADKGEFSHTCSADQRTKPGQVKTSVAAEDQPEKFGVEEENRGGDKPGEDGGEAGVRELAHLAAIAGELNERDHRKG